MPELPDITVYCDALAARVAGQPLERLRVRSPFLVRTVDPPLSAAEGRAVRLVQRLGKRIVFVLDGDLFLAIHLMIAGRLHWKARGAPVPGKVGQAALDFPSGTCILTEAGTKRRASLHLVQGMAGLATLDRGGVEPLATPFADFRAALVRENHTIKRTLTDPAVFAGIGNAYSDEILHRAHVSPVALTQKLDADRIAALYQATKSVLTEWTERLRAEVGDGFPEKVTAFQPGFAVHGRFKKPCPECGTAVQRIVHGEHETNYCPRCQTGGKLLADRSLSRLLKSDWPKTIEELESGQCESGPRKSGPVRRLRPDSR